jgi:hypothetical protein
VRKLVLCAVLVLSLAALATTASAVMGGPGPTESISGSMRAPVYRP